MPGRRVAYSLAIPLVGPEISASLKSVELELHIAGREVTQSLAPAPGLMHAFVWDGTDAYGRRLQGRHPIRARIGHTFPAVYQQPAEHEESFGRYSGNATTNTARQEITLWKEWKGALGTWDARGLGLGGWSLDACHFYDPIGHVLFMSDGRRRHVDAALGAATLTAFVREKAAQVAIDPATPRGVAVDATGTVYIVDYSGNRVHRISPNGKTTIHVGDGAEGAAGEVNLLNPSGAEIGSDGCLYLADTSKHRVLRVSPDGSTIPVAGEDVDGGDFSGDGGSANQAGLNLPEGVAVGPDGSVYIADTANRRVRCVGVDGIIRTIAGNGEDGSDGDGGPALQAQIGNPVDVAVGADGSVYVADDDAGLVRRIAPDGTIGTFAGTRERWTGEYEDQLRSGPAQSIPLAGASGIAVGADGAVYISTWMTPLPSVIWRVAPDGLASVIAGSGRNSVKEEPGAALEAQLFNPTRLAMDAHGALYVAQDDRSVLKLEAPFGSRVLGGTLVPDEAGVYLFEFDERGRHLRTRDSIDGSTCLEFEYAPVGGLSRVTDGVGAVLLAVERDSAGNAIALVTQDGTRHVVEIDRAGFLAAVDLKGTGRFTMDYASGGLLTKFARPWGSENCYAYDDLGRLIRDSNDEGHVVELARYERKDGFEVKTFTRLPPLFREKSYTVLRLPDGTRRRVNRCCTRSQQMEFRPDGSRTRRAADGTVTTVQMQTDPRPTHYAPIPRMIVIETPSGLRATLKIARRALPNPDGLKLPAGYEDTFTFNDSRTCVVSYDPRGRVLRGKLGKRVAEFTTDDSGRVTISRVTGRAETRIERDAAGKILALTEGSVSRRRTTYAYSRTGHLASITDPLDRTLHLTLESHGHVMGSRLEGGDPEALARVDDRGRTAALCAPLGEEHTFAYTPSGLMALYTPPPIGGIDSRIRWEYDSTGQLTRILKGASQALTFNRDEAGRLIGIEGHGVETRVEREPLSGRMARAISRSGIAVEFQHDGFLTTSTTFTGTVQGEITETFNGDFKVKSQSIAGREFEFYYDDDGACNGVDRLEIQRNSAGLVAKLKADEITVTYEYDEHAAPVGLRVKAGNRSHLELAWRRDALGRVIEQSETIGKVVTITTLSYDLGGRLIAETRAGATTSYSYDANGNRLARQETSGCAEAACDAQDRLERHGSLNFRYADDGTLLEKRDTDSRREWMFGFDALGALESAQLPDGTKLTYLNDAFGRRVGETTDGKLERGFLYHNSTHPAAEVGANGKVRTRFLYALGRHVPDLMIRGEQVCLIVSDNLGSPRQVIDIASGEIVQRMTFDAFGRILEDTKPGFQPFGFAGGLYDPRTGLTRFGCREYDTEIGRWTAKDPALFLGRDINLYAYCGNDPVNLIDPYGLECKCPDYSDLPEINDPISAFIWYFIGQGQPVRLGKTLLDSMKGAWGNYGGSESAADRGSVPFNWLDWGPIASRTTTGKFQFEQRGKIVLVSDKYHFPDNLKNYYIHVINRNESAIGNFPMLGNLPLAFLFGSTNGEAMPGVLPNTWEFGWAIVDALGHPTPLSVSTATPYQMFGCFELP